MKIRKGFVSNSSSSSYVIAITRDLQFSEKEIAKFREGYENHHGDECDFTTEQIQEIVTEIVDKLCREGQIYDEDCSELIPFADALDGSYGITNINVGCSEGGIINLLTDKDKNEVLSAMKKIVERNNEDA